MSQALQILDQVSVVAFAAVAVLAALGDWSRFLIPNRLSLAVMGLWAVHALLMALQGHSFVWILMSVLGALAVFLVGFGLFAARLLGGGDVKFVAAASLWAAPDFLVPFILIVTVSGALLGLAFLIPGIGNHPEDEVAPAAGPPAVDSVQPGIATAGRLGRKMPYGLAIAVGSIAVSLNLLNGLSTGG